MIYGAVTDRELTFHGLLLMEKMIFAELLVCNSWCYCNRIMYYYVPLKWDFDIFQLYIY